MDVISNTYVGRVSQPVELRYDKEKDSHYAYVKFIVNKNGKARLYEALAVRDTAKACAQYLKVGKEIAVTAQDEEPKPYVSANKELKASITLYGVKISFGKDANVIIDDSDMDATSENGDNAPEAPASESSLETDPIPF